MSKSTLRFLAQYLLKHKKWILFSSLFAAINAALVPQAAGLMKKFIDEGIANKDWDKILYCCGLVVALFFFDALTDFLHRLFLRVSVERLVKDLRRDIFQRFLFFSNRISRKYDSGKVLSHVIADVQTVSSGMHVVADLIREPLVLVSLLIWLFVFNNWRLTLVCFIALPIVAIIGKKLGESSKRNQKKIQASIENISSHIVESVGGLRTAHAFGQGARLKSEFFDKTEEAYKHLVKLARVEESTGPLTKWTTSWVGALLIGFGGWMVVNNQMTAGDLVSFIAAAGLLQQPLRQLNHVNVRLAQVAAAGERLEGVFREPLDSISNDQLGALNLTETQRVAVATTPVELELKKVSLKYEDSYALIDLDLKLSPGKKIALVGRSGSGKTTASMLALRFLDPTSGEVYLDSKKAKDWELAFYRANFSYVSQDVFLFHRSIFDNLTFVKPEATEEELWKALEQAQLKDFVLRLPLGGNTILDERASNLSGGERQRLALARAFLRNAPILILDEATSQLDSHSEKMVQATMEKLMEGRSTLIIAHRLSTIRNVDEIIVLERGQVVERGSPSELFQKSQGHFYELWKLQNQIS